MLAFLPGTLGFGSFAHDMSYGCGEMSCDSTQAFIAANQEMHDKMAVYFTCDVALDFVRGMIPHHEGAIVMCEILRRSTSELDPTLDQLCSDIEVEQEREVGILRNWLATNGHQESTSCEGEQMIQHMGMAMGCGDDSCASTSAFLQENMCAPHPRTVIHVAA